MAKDLWLPSGYELPNGALCNVLLYQEDDWQIYRVNDGSNALIVKPELLSKWTTIGLIVQDVFQLFSFGKHDYFFMQSNKRYVLAPISTSHSPESKADASAFALSLHDSRKIEKEASFHDAIYLEQYSRLLPSWTLSQREDDDVVFGTWLTGGVNVPVSSFRRLSNLTPWISNPDLKEVIALAGFTVNDNHYGIDLSNKNVTSKYKQTVAVSSDNNRIQKENSVSKNKEFSLPGRPELETFFNEHVIDIIINAERYKALGINFPSAIALHGPPGCGKTFAVEKLVEFLDWPSFSIDSNSVASPYIHDTSKKIAEVFDKAIDSSPSIIIIDEMESFLTDREIGASSGLHHVEEVAEFLRRIPEAISKNVLIIAMTNRIEMIDPAILRRGRFDHVIEVGMPTAKEVESLLNTLLSELPTEKNIDISKLILDLTNKPLSDVAFTIREAARLAARAGKNTLDQQSILGALESLPSVEKKDCSRKIGFIRE